MRTGVFSDEATAGGAAKLAGMFLQMNQDEFLQVVPLVKLSDADARLEEWLAAHGLTLSQVPESAIRQEVYRTVRGSESTYAIRRATLLELLGEEFSI